MTVRRYGLGYEGNDPSTYRSLGRLLVTIDDLRALVNLLSAEDPSRADVVIGFLGGSFDDPEDLRQLHDDELNRIFVATENILVTLAIDDASVQGDARLCEVVHQWAHSRRTIARPTFAAFARYLEIDEVLRSSTLKQRSLLVLGGLQVIGWVAWAVLMIIGIYWQADEWGWGSTETSVKIAIPVILAVGVAVFLVVWRHIPGLLPSSYAVVRPLSMAELRADRKASYRNRWSVAVAMAGVLVALLAILVTILVQN